MKSSDTGVMAPPGKDSEHPPQKMTLLPGAVCPSKDTQPRGQQGSWVGWGPMVTWLFFLVEHRLGYGSFTPGWSLLLC